MGCSACDDDPALKGGGLRQQADRIVGLPLEFPGDEKLAVDSPASCCTVYVAVNRTPGLEAAIVRVNLIADLFGTRELVASAFLPQGFRGPCIVVTGMQVDGWHVQFQATSSRVVLKAGIQAMRGCAGFAIAVPPTLLCPDPALTPLALLDPNPMPWTPTNGLWGLHTDDDEGVDAELVAGERVLGLTMLADPGADGQIEIDLCGGPRDTIIVPAGSSYELEPGGNLEGPGTITFANFLSWTVHTVR